MSGLTWLPKTLLLLLVCWGVCCALAHEGAARGRRPWGLRRSLLLGSVIWGALVVLITETLSLFTRFQRGWLLGAWLAATLCGAALVGGLRWRRVGGVAGESPLAAGEGELEREASPLSAVELVMLALIVAQAGTLAMVAYVYPPNNYDSINYHMARVMHWEQNRSVAFYATSIMMQTRGAPFAEYVIAHLQLLTEGDRFANLVQWFAMVLSLVGVSVIAGHLGASRSKQIAAALLCVSIPMGILQATSTQNDYVVAAWMVCFVAAGMLLLERPASMWVAACAGLALGLAVLAKHTALAYLPAFALVLGLKLLARRGWRAAGVGAIVVVLAIGVNAGFFARMMHLHGSPLGSARALTNADPSVGVMVSNMIRSTAINVPVETGVRVIDAAARGMMGWLRLLHEFTGQDPLDPRTSLVVADAFDTKPSTHEDLAGNPLHTMLVLAAVVVCSIAGWRRRPWPGPRRVDATPIGVPLFAACLVAGFMFFNFYFMWQPWHTRLQLPLFVLGAPLIAAVLLLRPASLVLPLVVGLLGFYWTFENATRPIGAAAPFTRQTRSEMYFANRPDLFPIHSAVADAIAATRCRDVGLYIGSEPFEYPLWILLKERGHRAVVRHLHVPDPTEVYAPGWFQPCAVVSTGVADAWRGTRFELARHYSDDYVTREFGQYRVHLHPGVLRDAVE
jgi:hypothetical protein